MDGARDIVKLALPFAAGALSFSCLSPEINNIYTTAALSFPLLSAMIVLLVSGKISPTAGIMLSGYIAGVFAFANSSLCQLTESGNSVLVGSASRLGYAMQNCIDGIEFQSKNTNALIKALLTGNRDDIPAELTEAFRSSGAAHILALSGLHLGIVYLIISKLGKIAGGHPKAVVIRSILCISLCTLYSLATGAGPSITRALIFVIISETARLLYRKSDLKSTLASSLLIQLSLNPADISSVGFQLSYAAIAGIAWINPYMKAIWPDDDQGTSLMKKIWDSASVSISCQITTGPLAWLYFGTFPQYFILTNLIAIPLTGLIIPAALLTTALTSMGICPHLLITSTETLVEALCRSLAIIASL